MSQSESGSLAHQLKAEAAPQLARLGVQRLEAGDRANAREMFLGALSADFGHVGAWQGLGSLALGPDRYAASIAIGRRALAMAPNDFHLKLNLGNVLWRAQRFAEAEPLLREAFEAAPDEAATNQNLALLYYAIGPAELAEKHFARALELSPDSTGLRGDHAHGVLKTGNLSRGLRLLECRWDGLLPKNAIWECGLSQWWGEPAKTLLLHHEQGYGDTIQFIRFVPAIKARAGADRVIFACPKPLHKLFAGQCGIDEVIDENIPGEVVRAARRADFHCPLMSAATVLGPQYRSNGIDIGGIPGDTLVGNKPYLEEPADANQPKALFRAGGADLAVGLCWGASFTPERGTQKSVPLDEIVALGWIPGVRLWSLQFGPHAEKLHETAADHLIGSVPGGIGDFADTAAIMNKLDLIVSIDTSAAHLAGALGRPVFMLNPINPCWRWVRGAGPWYETMVIFDQKEPDNWRAPIAAICDRILRMVVERRETAVAA